MTIEERVEKLELKLTRARFINRLLAVLGMGVVLVMWFFTSVTTTAQSRVLAGVNSKEFVLYDDNGRIRAILCMNADGPTFDLFDENGTQRVELSVHADESYLGLTNENLKGCVLSMTEDGPSLVMQNENGKVLWSAP